MTWLQRTKSVGFGQRSDDPGRGVWRRWVTGNHDAASSSLHACPYQ
jgi:hypothetical protein